MKKINLKEKLERKTYQDLFDVLMYLASLDNSISKETLESFDEVADYLGDIAKGRRAVPTQPITD